MSRSSNEREKFIEMLKETPFVSFVCRKMGLSRTTIYRWRKSNTDFNAKIDEALEFGRDNISDMAETCLTQKVRDGDMVAIKFWLQHNNSKYIPVRTVYVEPPHQHGKLRPGVPCKSCGHMEFTGFDPHNELPPQPKKRSQLTKEILKMQHKKMTEEEILREFNRRPRSMENTMASWDMHDSELRPPESDQP